MEARRRADHARQGMTPEVPPSRLPPLPDKHAPGLLGRAVAWGQRNMPTREGLERNRWIRPVAHRVLAPALWRANRRSVPRGVALGMVTGILFPVAQIFFSALLAFPLRANIPAAALTTFITNPFTTPPLWIAAAFLGNRLLRLDRELPGSPVADAAQQIGWLPWLMDRGAEIGLGLLIITVALSALGYALSALGWRLWIARKWAHRRHEREIDPPL